MDRKQLRQVRTVALQALYQLDTGREWKDVSAFLAEPGPSVAEQAQALAESTWARRRELDEILTGCLENWSVARLGGVERAALRLALYEFLDRPDVPVAVVIDEAVELVKRFASERSGALVNAVLDRAKTVRDECRKTS